MGIELELRAAACYNSPTDYDAEIMFRLPNGQRGQKVIKKALSSREEALKVADELVNSIGLKVQVLCREAIEQFKDAQE